MLVVLLLELAAVFAVELLRRGGCVPALEQLLVHCRLACCAHLTQFDYQL